MALAATLLASAAWAAELMTPAASDLFERRVRPLLAEHCYECHSGDEASLKGELRLDSPTGIARGGSSGPAVVPGDEKSSLLMAALRYESLEMPPTGKLPAEAIEPVAQWLSQLDERFVHAGSEIERPDHNPSSPSDVQLWSLQPRVRPPLPEVHAANRVRTGADAFVLAKLENRGLSVAPDATPRDLVRRVTYDLTGLPPEAAEVAAFEHDPTDANYAALVDRLLASPQFGERWARLWLDVARYADTKGYLFLEDRNYANAWKYRDWVVAAFNADLPYDKFLVAQLAGEQTGDPATAPAAGFLTLGRRFLNNAQDIIDDRIDVTTRGLMGMTVACARCHDHKYDPIPTADYYALYGVFASCDEQTPEGMPPALVDHDPPVTPVVFQRGNPGSPGAAVTRRFLTCLGGSDAAPFPNGSGRKDLADAIARPQNPLTARVWANRVWARLIGRGIVATTSDFGTRGEPPTHPELLDYLASELVDHGWSTKSLIRQIVLSTAYRQAVAPHDEAAAKLAEDADPENLLLWHAWRKRLDLEEFRDSVLAAAGQLDKTPGGPSTPLTEGAVSHRRALYGTIDRQNLPGFFRTFDFANPNSHVAQRAQTLTPQQSLYLLNSPLVQDAACALAARAAAEGPPQSRVDELFHYALARAATPGEIAAGADFLSQPVAADEQAIPARSPWSYGYGGYDEASQQVRFTPFAHFTGSAWQASATFPDPQFACAMLTAGGGHPGRPGHAVVLRYTSRAHEEARLAANIRHAQDQGDGVRVRLVSSRRGLLATAEVFHGVGNFDWPPLPLEVGERIDWVVDCRENDPFDTFELSAEVAAVGADGRPRVERSQAGFHGPEPPLMDRWQQFAQALLMCNEFMFID